MSGGGARLPSLHAPQEATPTEMTPAKVRNQGGHLTAPALLPSYREFFGQGWMKLEKNERTPYIMKTTKHFNDVSRGWAVPFGLFLFGRALGGAGLAPT